MMNYQTLSEALLQLRERGIRNSFQLKNERLECVETGKSYPSGDIRITEYYRFEGESNPSDMSVLFVIECADGEKGTVISSYGTYADVSLLEFMDELKIEDRTKVAGPGK